MSKMADVAITLEELSEGLEELRESQELSQVIKAAELIREQITTVYPALGDGELKETLAIIDEALVKSLDGLDTIKNIELEG